jgi:hypothetical protein
VTAEIRRRGGHKRVLRVAYDASDLSMRVTNADGVDV